MDAASVWDTALAVLLSIGGGGAIVLALSTFLGRVWANRLLETERHNHAEKLARLESELRRRNDDEITRVRAALDLLGRVQYHQFSDKLTIYRGFADIIAQLIVELEIASRGAPRTAEQEVQFELHRLRAYGYVAMLAPQAVMGRIDELMDYLMECTEDLSRFEFAQVRSLAYAMINEIRKDIGINEDPVAYTGHR